MHAAQWHEISCVISSVEMSLWRNISTAHWDYTKGRFWDNRFLPVITATLVYTFLGYRQKKQSAG